MSFFKRITGAKLLSDRFGASQQYDIVLKDGLVEAIEPHTGPSRDAGGDSLDARGCLLGPSLCHAHIHLDKAFILNHEKFADLEVKQGDFKEAIRLTTLAKQRFENNDLLRRGRWLIEESLSYGVTHMRAFVEVDATVQHRCLDAAVQLQEEFKDMCRIQLVAFAQDPIFSGEHAEENRRLLQIASGNGHVEVIGTTPYVEDAAHMSDNMEWAIKTAIACKKHLDLHLDYNVDPSIEPQIDLFIDLLRQHHINASDSASQITLGHCTRMTLFNQKMWRELSQKCSDLPIHFVGLPTSDLFIMGKPDPDALCQDRHRGTLQIPHLIRQHGLSCAFSINNVGNAFTPYGSCDPLSVASMCVGIYQAGTKQDAQLLYECVSSRAKLAIALGDGQDAFAPGAPADFVIYGDLGSEATSGTKRRRQDIAQLVYDPTVKRTVIFQGKKVVS